MSKIDDDLVEISSFLTSWKPGSPEVLSKAIRPKVKSSYKQFHSMLVWGLVVDTCFPKHDSISVFFRECLSDISHAYLLNLCSLYKSSRSSLRSGIENAIRVSLIVEGVEVERVKSVYGLFDLAKETYKGDLFALGRIISLQSIYGDLCKSVHSASPNYLSLSVPFSELSIVKDAEFEAENERLRSVCSTINQCAFWFWSEKLSAAGHANADMVRDAVPRMVKRAKSAQHK